jgi:branched-chain amino acid transport system ATP-binding protein
MTPLLRVDLLSKRFGGLTACDKVSFDVAAGEIVGLIGPNGAGKTTVFNQIAGLIRLDSGRVVFDGRILSGRPPHRVCRAGVVKTFQNVASFGDMTVLENATVGGLAHAGLVEARERAHAAIARAGLAGREQVLAGNLSLPERARLEIARALATRPRLMLLDEAMATLAPAEQRDIVALVRLLRDEGITFVVIEHHMKTIMSMCERILVLNFGRLIAQGTPQQVSRDPQVITAYLGTAASAGAAAAAATSAPEAGLA